MKNPFLIGERLYCRPLERDDAALVASWLNDPEVRLYLRLARPLNLQAELEFIDKMSTDVNNLALFLALKEDDRPIGVASLQNIDARNHKAEFGIGIGEKSLWSQGLGREATKLIVEHGFDTLNLHRIVLYVYEFNERAIRCYEKLGFQHEGRLRQDQFNAGRYWDTIIMGILREEWRGVHGKRDS